MIKDSNKASYFFLDIDKIGNSELIYNDVDLVLNAMKVDNIIHRYEDQKKMLYLFKCEQRKRRGQLQRLATKYLSPEIEFNCQAMERHTFEKALNKLNKSGAYKITQKPKHFQEYTGNDIKFFQNKQKWHAWQNNIYDLLFNEKGQINQADTRKIVSIVDEEGNSGKSSFFKFLFFKNPSSIGRLSYGSASQLRASLTNLGPKEIYIIDLARTKSKNDNEEDILSVIEDLKNGLVVNSMYGAGKTLICEPPHIILSSNYYFNFNTLSSDRWNVFRITKQKRLRKINIKTKRVSNNAKKLLEA